MMHCLQKPEGGAAPPSTTRRQCPVSGTVITPFVFEECIQTIYPIDGYPIPVTPGTVIEYEVPDKYDRPWARIWERYFEASMDRPEQDADIFSFD